MKYFKPVIDAYMSVVIFVGAVEFLDWITAKDLLPEFKFYLIIIMILIACLKELKKVLFILQGGGRE